MQKCEKCHITIRGTSEKCPLCQGVITKDDSENIYPYVPNVYEKFSKLFFWLLFSAIIVCFVCIFINVLSYRGFFWAGYVIAGMFCALLLFSTSLRVRYGFHKMIVGEVIVISLLSLGWDILTGWHAWSVSYVIPIICMIGSINMMILCYVKKEYMEENLAYFLFLVFLGVVPTIFLLSNIVSTKYPSLICILLNIMSFLIMCFFRWDFIWEEVQRRLHL